MRENRDVSLIQERMSLDRRLIGARVVTFAAALFAVVGVFTAFADPRAATVGSLGLTVCFTITAITGSFRWRRARQEIALFEDRHGAQAGRRKPVS